MGASHPWRARPQTHVQNPGCLEATGSPTTVEVKVLNRCLTENRASIWAGVDNAAPLTIHSHATEDWE